MNLAIIISIVVLLTVTTTIITYALNADIIRYDHIPISVNFNYAIESSIARFKDFLTLIATFVITVQKEDYQLEKEHDYAWLLVSFVYDTNDPTTTTSILTTRSDANITSDMKIQKQESITIIKHTMMNTNIQFIINVEIEEGDNT